MRGLHLTADLYQCRCERRWLDDATALGAWARQAAGAVGLEVRHQLAEPDEGGGVSAALLLPHSHVCVHTWPARRGVTIDVALAGDEGDLAAKARELMDMLLARFMPEWTEQRSLDRGNEDT